MNKDETNKTKAEQRQSLIKSLFRLPDTRESLDVLKCLRAAYPVDDEILEIALGQKIATIQMLLASRSLEAAVDGFYGRFALALEEAGAEESK